MKMEYSNSSSATTSDDEEYDGLLKKALEVEFSEDFNPNSIPRDGHEFLQHVVYERRKCKKLATSNINPESFRQNQTFSIKLDEPLKKNSKMIPSRQWQIDKLAQFQDFWQYLHSVMDNPQNIKSVDEETFTNIVYTQKPVYSEFKSLAQCSKIKMLEVLSKHITTLEPIEKLNGNVGMWIFAVLASLDIPLSPSDCFIMREFCKRCIQVRSNLPDEGQKECATVLNFFICIVGRFYNQLDLADS